MRLLRLLVVLSLGCTKTVAPDASTAEPAAEKAVATTAPPTAATTAPSTSTSPGPGATASSRPAASAAPPGTSKAWASVTAGSTATHVCEPTVACGVWSGCKWLRRVDATHFRDESTKTVYVRRHVCASPGAAPTECALFCSAPDAGPPCLDGLHPEQEACDKSAAPRPTTAKCLHGDGVCDSFM